MTVEQYIEKTAEWIIGVRKDNKGNFCSTFRMLDEQHWRKCAVEECEELAGVPEKFIGYILNGQLNWYIKFRLNRWDLQH